MKRFLCIVLLLLWVFYNSFWTYEYELDDLLFLIPNYILSAFLILSVFSLNDYNFSFNNIFYLFYFFFFGVAPVFQYFEGVNIWGGSNFTREDYVITTITSFFAILLYSFINQSFRNKMIHQRQKLLVKKVQSNHVKINPFLLMVISFVSFLIYFSTVDFNLFKLLIRGGEGLEISNEMSTSSYLLISKFVRPMSAAALLIFKISKCKNRVIEIVLWIILLLANSPFGMARFSVAAFYIPVLFLYSVRLRKKNNFSLFLILSVLLVFPFLNQFRYWGSSDITFGLNFDMFLAGHFDSFQMFMRVLKENIITYGHQLLGVLLFFFPRSLWPDKPIGSGHFVAGESGLYFDNISMNYFGEGYLNFGFLGVFLFVVLIAYFNAYMDVRFWKAKNGICFVVYYYLLLGMEFVILRGQLMSFFPIAIGYLVSTYVVYKISVCK